MDDALPRAKRVGSCIVWPDAIQKNSGYGITAWNGARAHRIAFVDAWKIDPGQAVIRHMCGNRACVNYLHLLAGEDEDNHDDTTKMGRRRADKRLTFEQEEQVLALSREGYRQADIAVMFGVGQSNISRVCQRLDPGGARIREGKAKRHASDEDVLLARRDYTAGRATIREIADRLGMSWPSAQKMIQGRTYQHVADAHTGPPVVSQRGDKRVCSIVGCDRPMLARGWCHVHYDRWRLTGDLGLDKPVRGRLTEEGVRRIRKLRNEGWTIAAITTDVGMSRGAVEGVLTGRTWAHVEDEPEA